ncbi:MAG: hypothetical protein DRP82_03780 [Planctomycetota bacterium]|nr:MAG: hypothetical protein DRP82_03780 [Planctomycetota bacterium]
MRIDKLTPEMRKVLQFVSDFARCVQVRKMYPPEHPFISESAKRALTSATSAFEVSPSISLGVSPSGFYILDEELQKPPPICRDLANLMRRIGLDTITVHKGVDEGEIASFAQELAELDAKVLRGGDVSVDPDDVARRYPHIEVNAFKWTRVTTKETKILQKVKERAEELGEDEMKVVDYLLQAGEGDLTDDLPSKVLISLLEASPDKVSEMVHQAVLKAGLEEEEGVVYEIQKGAVTLPQKVAQTIFDKIALALVEGEKAASTDVENAFYAILKGLPPSILKTLFGSEVTTASQEHATELLKSLSRRVRTKILINELLKEYSDAEMEQVVRKVVTFGAEMAEIAELLSQELKRLASEESRERALRRLMSVVRQEVEGRVTPRYKALVVEPDANTVAIYKAAFYEHSCRVKVVSDAETAMRELNKNGYDIVALELKLKGTVTGHEILNHLRKKNVPVIIGTEIEAFKNDFEVATYKKKRFLVKPLTIEDVGTAVEELLEEGKREVAEAAAGGGSPSPVRSEELEEAAAIQKGLLPKELPSIESFLLAAAYAPCKGVGGDLYDVVHLSNGKIGIFVGDVSGKGISAAMVMVLVRTLFRTIAAFHESPRQTLIHLNKLLSREMAEGMFVSAVYVVIDPKRRELFISSAGHCPPLFWATERDKVIAQFIGETGMVMGLGDTEVFRNKTKEFLFQVDPGVGLLLYTDGITEAMNESGEQFGEERLIEVIRSSGTYEPERILANIYGAVDLFRGEVARSDDMTVFCIKCVG